jgi:hypothetical protein
MGKNKIQADITNGIEKVKAFDKNAEILSENLFLSILDSPFDGVIGCVAGDKVLNKLKKEYGVKNA